MITRWAQPVHMAVVDSTHLLGMVVTWRLPQATPVHVLPVGLISRALDLAGRLANDAAEVITATAGRLASPGAKAHPFDWVTDTDRTLERHTRRAISAEFPGSAVLGEEYGSSLAGSGPLALPGEPGAAELLWIVDPVDGTANYVAGIPWCCYSLALIDAQGPLVGVIADPYQGQIYAAARGLGLRANGRRVPPSPLTQAVADRWCSPNRPSRGNARSWVRCWTGPERPTQVCEWSGRRLWPSPRSRWAAPRPPCCRRPGTTSGTSPGP